MRVPSIGLTSEERRIVAEGHRLAKHMLRNYQDPPSLASMIGKWLALARIKVLARD